MTKSTVPPNDTPVVTPAEWSQKAYNLSSCIDRSLFSGIELEAGKALYISYFDHRLLMFYILAILNDDTFNSIFDNISVDNSYVYTLFISDYSISTMQHQI